MVGIVTYKLNGRYRVVSSGEVEDAIKNIETLRETFKGEPEGEDLRMFKVSTREFQRISNSSEEANEVIRTLYEREDRVGEKQDSGEQVTEETESEEPWEE